MRIITSCIAGSVMLCASLSPVYAKAAMGASEQIQQLNKQLQSQMKTMQETQQKQMQMLNKQLQQQMKDIQTGFQTQMQEMNKGMNKRMELMQKQLQEQIKQVYKTTQKIQ